MKSVLTLVDRRQLYFEHLIDVFDGLYREWWIRFKDGSYTKYFFINNGFDVILKSKFQPLNSFEVNFSVEKYLDKNVSCRFDWDFIIDIDSKHKNRKQVCKKIMKLLDSFGLVYLVDNRYHIWFPSWTHSLISKWNRYYNRDFAVHMKYFIEIISNIKNKAEVDAGLWYVHRHKIRVPYTFHLEDKMLQVFVDQNFNPLPFKEACKIWKGTCYGKNEIVKANSNFKRFIDYAFETGKILYKGFNVHDFNVEVVRISTGNKELRPCFKYAVENITDMPHELRIALVYEAVCCGYKDVMEIAKLFEKQTDFNLNRTLYQINYLLRNSRFIKPYRCGTIMRKGWCIRKECKIYKEKLRNS